MYRGIAPPAFGYEQASHTMPKPIKGSRSEVFEQIQEIYENILNQLMPQERVLRFVGEYEFSTMPQATLAILTNIYNRGIVMMWAPHSDYPKICYPVHIETFDPRPVNGMISLDGMVLKVKAIETTNFIPNLDLMYKLTGRYPWKASVYLASSSDILTGWDCIIEKFDTFDYSTIGCVVDTAGSFTAIRYVIKTVGTTDFTLIGSPDNNLGRHFLATGAGSGTGTAFRQQFTATGEGTPDGQVWKV